MIKMIRSINGALALFAILMVFDGQSQMSGTYTVGGTPAPDFGTIQEACDSLVSQGVSGAVTINIRDGVYNEAVILDTVPGASATNIITFQSENLNNSLVSVSAFSLLGTFQISSDHVRLNELSIISTFGTSVFLSEADNLEVISCVLSATDGYALRGTTTTLPPGTNVIDNVRVLNSTLSGYEGVSLICENVTNAWFENSSFSVSQECLGIQGGISISDITVTNCDFLSGFGGIDFNSSQSISNVSIVNTTYSINVDAVYINGEYDVDNITIDSLACTGFFPGGNTDAIAIRGNTADISNIALSRLYIDSVRYGVEIDASGSITNLMVDDAHIDAGERGFEIDGGSLPTVDVTVTNSTIRANLFEAFEIDLDANLINFTLINDSLVSPADHALLIDSYGSEIANVLIDSLYAESDTTDQNTEGIYLNCNDGRILDFTLRNSTVLGGRGMYMYAYQEIDDLELMDVGIYGLYDQCCSAYGLSLEGEQTARDIRLTNAFIYSKSQTAITFNAGSGLFDQIRFNNVTAEGDQTGLEVYAYAGISDWTIDGSSFTGTNTQGAYIYSEYGGLMDFHIDSSIFTGPFDGLGMQGYYAPGMFDISITNCTISTSPTAPNADGIELYTESVMDGLLIDNNTVNLLATNSGTGIYASAYGGLRNAKVQNNQVKVAGPFSSGIGFEYADSGNTIRHNVVDTLGVANLRYGIWISGEYNSNTQVDLDSNTVNNAEYGLYAQHELTNLRIRGNRISTDFSSGSITGLYLQEVEPGGLLVDGNSFLNHFAGRAIDMDEVYLGSSQKGWISNNFFSNYNQGLDARYTENLVLANNSFAARGNASFFDLGTGTTGIEFYNNIVKVDSTAYTNNMFEFDEFGAITGMDNNIYNHHPSNANHVFDNGLLLNYNTISDWSVASGQDGNSILYEVSFVNDTTDLHVMCSDVTLLAGMPLSEVPNDIDGHARATVPTIGADEILSNTNVLAQDTIWFCTNPVTLSAGSPPGATYLWSTTETTPTIQVSTPGTYTIDVMDACGTYSDMVEVVQVTNTTAAASHQVSFLTVLFTNGSSNANSYLWDFGDGNTSTDMNPSHTYAAPQTYTVTLIAYGECNNDTMQFMVDPTTVGIEEVSGFEMAVYPNPTRGELTVTLMNYNGGERVLELMDLSGRLLESQNLPNGQTSISMNLSGYSSGTYLIHARSGDHREVMRVIKR